MAGLAKLRKEIETVSRNIIAAVEDIFFAAKIRATAEHLGIEVRFIKSIDALIESARAERPTLIIADLHAERLKPDALAEKLKSDEHLKNIPLIGFFSHVQTDLQRRALESGFDRVLPRSAFTKNLPEILQSENLLGFKGDAG